MWDIRQIWWKGKTLMLSTKPPEFKAQPSCEDRIDESLANDLDELLQIVETGATEEGTEAWEYGLSFDYSGSFWRLVLMTGGPHAEFRFSFRRSFDGPMDVEYMYADWGDSARRWLDGWTGDRKANERNLNAARALWDTYFVEQARHLLTEEAKYLQ